MPGPSDIARGNIQNSFLLQFAVASGSALVANTSEERTYTVPGLQVTDSVTVSKPTFQAGVAIANARVSAANTLAVTFGNFGATTPTLTAETYSVEVNRPSNPQTPLPTAIT